MPTSSGFQLLQVPPSSSSWPSGLYGFASNAGADDGATARSARGAGQLPQACETHENRDLRLHRGLLQSSTEALGYLSPIEFERAQAEFVVRITRRCFTGKRKWAMQASKSSMKHCTAVGNVFS